MEAFWALKELKITTISLKRIRGKRQKESCQENYTFCFLNKDNETSQIQFKKYFVSFLVFS